MTGIVLRPIARRPPPHQHQQQQQLGEYSAAANPRHYIGRYL